MSENITEIPYTPESINHQLSLGKSREELSNIFGHKNYRSLENFMRRRGYAWNQKKQIFEKKVLQSEEKEEYIVCSSKKVRQILKLFKEGKDPQEIASMVGFKNHLILAEYLKEKGYLWNHNTYRYEKQQNNLSQEPEKEKVNKLVENELFKVLIQNKEKLMDMLSIETKKSLPRYSLPGFKIAKTIHISNRLSELIKSFTEDKDIKQREFFEIASLEMMNKYGYEAEVKGILE